MMRTTTSRHPPRAGALYMLSNSSGPAAAISSNLLSTIHTGASLLQRQNSVLVLTIWSRPQSKMGVMQPMALQ